ncbi:MAG: hypothetical protein ACI4KL_01470 [Lentihominibacter sp.]
MACFLVPAAEAIVATAATKIAESKKEEVCIEHTEAEAEIKEPAKAEKPLFVKQLSWLSYMLWGGAALLCFEHVWHGEVVPWAPFLTAAANPADRAEMLHEMATAGTCMAVLITAVWVGMVIVTNVIAKREPKAQVEAK